MADNHYVSCIAASYISFTNRPVKTGCVKTKLSAISSLGLGWKILQMLQPLRKPFADGRSGWRIRPFNCFSPLADVSAWKTGVRSSNLNAHFQKTKVRFQKAAFFPVGGSGILIQVLPDLATSFANSCTSSDSRPHYSGRSGSCQNTSPRAERTCSFRKT